MQAQRLDEGSPFGSGPSATYQAIEHLGYVQIDTINVIERAHHHILWSRIPDYHPRYLETLQSQDKNIFEYWTHALAILPITAFPFFIDKMQEFRKRKQTGWYESVKPAEAKRVLKTIRDHGPLSIRDIKDDVLVEKDHEWASKKPSKRALEFLFYSGQVVISKREGMVKQYEITERHFGWKQIPKKTSAKAELDYRLDRALKSQGIVSLESIAHLQPKAKAQFEKLIQQRVKQRTLIELAIEDMASVKHWAKPEANFQTNPEAESRIHILSPFDPLVIQRKRLKLFFDYEHRFEAYLPKEKRKFGYFTLPVFRGTEVVALLDTKADRADKKLLIQKWIWLKPKPGPALKRSIEETLHRFEKFQLAD